MKAVVRDLKSYIAKHAPRTIPVGYSAADDLKYRISLSRYLECGNDSESVDFYGVNSYQWCGYQTFASSGYDVLVSDYKDYTLPVFFSEYGCNEVSPRNFQEVSAVYSPTMTDVIGGGLIYEFSQEPNNYGLVEVDAKGDVFLLPDFLQLKKAYENTSPNVWVGLNSNTTRPSTCQGIYSNINTMNPLPETVALDLLQAGIMIDSGTYVDLNVSSTTFRIFNVDNTEILDKTVIPIVDWKAPMDPISEFPKLLDDSKGGLLRNNQGSNMPVSDGVSFKHVVWSTAFAAMAISVVWICANN